MCGWLFWNERSGYEYSVPCGGAAFSQTLKSVMLWNGGTSKPSMMVQRSSTCGRSASQVISSFAAVLLRLNCHKPQNHGPAGVKRPFGPDGAGNAHVSAAICGASRFATAQADGGFQINADLPETKARLFDASS